MHPNCDQINLIVTHITSRNEPCVTTSTGRTGVTWNADEVNLLVDGQPLSARCSWRAFSARSPVDLKPDARPAPVAVAASDALIAAGGDDAVPGRVATDAGRRRSAKRRGGGGDWAVCVSRRLASGSTTW